MRLPAVVTVDLRIIGKKAVRNEALAGADAEWDETQRYASLKGIMAAKKKEIRERGARRAGRHRRAAHEGGGLRGAAGAQGRRQGRPRSRSWSPKLHNEAKVI